MNHFWRLSEAGPDNLGLACTDEGLLLGHTSLIERRGGRFVVRERNEIDRLLKRTYNGEPPVDRLMSRLATVARALNANDQCLVRIAAVHLEIPDLPSAAARDAMAAEDLLIKYARDEGSVDASWNPALHPRTGMPPNSGWFAPTGGTGNESADDESSRRESRLRYAEKRDDSHRTDAPPTSVDLRNQPAAGSFWPNVSSAVLNWLQESVPEYDLESGRVVGERPRWQAIAPYVGVLAATAAMFGGEALAPTVPLILGLGGSETAGIALTERVAQIHGVLDPIAQGMRTTAVLETDIGRIVAGGARDLAPAQRGLLAGGELATQAPGVHAEITALRAAANLGATPRAIAVSRAICQQCAATIEASGGTLTSPTTAVWPRP